MMGLDDLVTRFWTNIAGRIEGPLMFRFLCQPTMAVLYGLRDGVTDARNGRSAFGWALITQPGNRARLLRQGAVSVGRLIAIGLAMDLLYQLFVFRWVYPLELMFVVLLLVFVPYVLVRGPANRLARSWLARRSPAR